MYSESIINRGTINTILVLPTHKNTKDGQEKKTRKKKRNLEILDHSLKLIFLKSEDCSKYSKKFY